MRASAETPYLCCLLMKTFAERVIAFNRSLRFTGNLPEGIRVITRITEPDPAQLEYGRAMQLVVAPLADDVVTYAFEPA